MERPSSQERIEVRLLPPGEAFLPKRLKVCVDVEVPGQKAIKNLTDKDRIKLGKKVAQVISDIQPIVGPILMTIDGVKEGFVNVGVYTDNLPDVSTLRDTEGIYPQFAYDISDQENPEPLLEEHWLKR